MLRELIKELERADSYEEIISKLTTTLGCNSNQLVERIVELTATTHPANKALYRKEISQIKEYLENVQSEFTDNYDNSQDAVSSLEYMTSESDSLYDAHSYIDDVITRLDTADEEVTLDVPTDDSGITVTVEPTEDQPTTQQ